MEKYFIVSQVWIAASFAAPTDRRRAWCVLMGVLGLILQITTA